MVRIPELGIDDSTPQGQEARAVKRAINLAGVGPGAHGFARLPSYEGYAGHCLCGWEPEGAFEHLGELTGAIWRHLEEDAFPKADESAMRTEADFYRLGDLIGYQRVTETDGEGCIRHVGWAVAGQRGSVYLPDDGVPHFNGTWRTFTAGTDSAATAGPQG